MLMSRRLHAIIVLSNVRSQLDIADGDEVVIRAQGEVEIKELLNLMPRKVTVQERERAAEQVTWKPGARPADQIF